MTADERAALQNMVRRGYTRELCGGHDGYQWRTVDVLAKSLSALDAAEAERDAWRDRALATEHSLGAVLAQIKETPDVADERDAAIEREALTAFELDVANESARMWENACAAAIARADAAVALLREARLFVAQDAQMMADITRHSPLDRESQAKHDATPSLSELLLPRIDAALAAKGEQGNAS